MSAREDLAENIRCLVEQAGSQSALAKKCGVPQRTISRAMNAENATTVDTLNDLAKGLGMQPWQLLVSGLDPSNPPLLFLQDAPNPNPLLQSRRAQ